MTSQKTVFVDMDGVVADFVGGALDAHEFPPDALSKAKGSYDIHTHLNMSAQDFWTKINEVEHFWPTLNLTVEANKLMQIVETFFDKSNVFFLTSPSLDPECYTGKIRWIEQHFPEYKRRTILTSYKHLLAKRDRVLIDDSDSNINQFTKAGGNGILFPRPWNSRHHVSDKALEIFALDIKRFR